MAILLGSCFLRHGSQRGTLNFNSYSIGFLSGTECQTSALLLSFPSSLPCLWHSLLQARSPFYFPLRFMTAVLSCPGLLWLGDCSYFRLCGELLWTALSIFASTTFLSTNILWVPGSWKSQRCHQLVKGRVSSSICAVLNLCTYMLLWLHFYCGTLPCSLT